MFGTSAAFAPAQAADQVIKIGVDLPVSGADASDGIPTQNGVALAIEEANAHAPAGFKFQMDALDDAVGGVHNPQQGATNIRSLAADPEVMGVVGPFNSNVAAAEIPVSNEAGLPLISPSNTNPTLTSAKYRTTHPKEITYFRVCATDDLQGKAGAEFAKELGFKKVYVVDDNETYGLGLANVFEKEFKSMGGTVLGHDHLTANQQDFKALLTKIAATHPDAIYYGGVTSTGGGLLRQQMAGAGLNPAKIPFEGGDGISDEAFIKIAGPAANNSYYTVAAPNAQKLASAQAFIKAYKAKYKSDIGAYSANAYVAANVMIDAVERAIKANGGKMPTRAQVLKSLQATKDFKSIIGTFGFTTDGNTNNPVISLWKVANDKQVFLKQALIAR
ncbi:MAG TPA: branched-chain amino acid ABC transporter substrate-binding protein [Candidatus Dormibacteraeota bacterium]|nr:branched-chain amino acid ABC transporter substrate-binding protein [Candidatus Dormibacteraeota bacterium]